MAKRKSPSRVRSSAEVLGARVRHYRLARSLTQQALADLASVQREDVSRIEHGRLCNPKLRAIESLAKALGVQPGDLLDVPRPSAAA